MNKFEHEQNFIMSSTSKATITILANAPQSSLYIPMAHNQQIAMDEVHTKTKSYKY